MSERQCLDDAAELEHEDLTVPGFDAHQAILGAFAAPKERRTVRMVIVPCVGEFNDEGLVTLIEPPGSMPLEFGREVVRRVPGASLDLVDGPDEPDCGPYGVMLTEGMRWSEVFPVYVEVAQQFGWRLDRLSSAEAVLSKEE